MNAHSSRADVRGEPIDGTFITSDGLVLSTWRLHKETTAHQPIILIHGLGDHSRTSPYLRLGRFLAERGFEVFAFDRRGSGRSRGLANYAAKWEDLRDDLTRFVDIVEDRCGRLPSLVGLSFGGLQVLDFALTSPESVHSCVTMAPALDVSGTSPWLRRILPYLASWRPMLSVDPGLDDSALTRDPVVCREYRNDPLWQARTTPALALLTIEAIDRVHARAEQLSPPLLVLHGTADRVVPIGGTRRAFPRFGSPDKTFREIPGAFHALPIEPEPDGEQVCTWIAEWLKTHPPSALTPVSARE